mgnify:FL=1
MLSKIKKNEKGFTLMEMLIVVAIIAVLVAIAIPTFTSSLNKAKGATDAANIRAGYASMMLQVLEGDLSGNNAKINPDTAYYLQKDGTVAATSANDYVCYGASGSTEDVAGQDLTWEKGKKITYTYGSTSGKVTIAVVDAG